MIRSARDLTLLKRPNGVYHVRFWVRGREYRRSCGSTVESVARQRAWAIYRAEAGDDSVVAPAPLRNTYATIGDVCDRYLEAAGGTLGTTLSSKTAAANVATLLRVLVASGRAADRDAARELRATVVDESLVLAFFRARYAQRGLTWGKDHDLRLNTSLNSELRRVKSIFGRRGLRALDGLKLPEFRTLAGLPSLRQARTEFVPIPADVDQRMQAEAAALMRSPANIDRRIAVAYEMMRFAGLRSSEAAALRWSWIEHDGDRVEIALIAREASHPTGPWRPKAREGRVPVRADRVAAWRAALPPADPHGYVLGAGSETARVAVVERDLCQWVRRFLPDRQKAAYELRKQAGSDVLTRTGSMAHAAAFLRDSVATCERHYARFLAPAEAL